MKTNRRSFLSGAAGAAVVASLKPSQMLAQSSESVLNLAKVAVPSSLLVTSENKITALNDGAVPTDSRDRSHGLYAIRHAWGNEDDSAHWVQYTWSEPVTINKADVYWAVDAPRSAGFRGSEARLLAAPVSYQLQYWNGSAFVPVPNARGLGLAEDTFNVTTFDQITTDKVRLDVTPDARRPAGILEWRVYNAGAVPSIAPLVDAGIDRSVVMGGQTYLMGKVTFLEEAPENVTRWTKTSGPGTVQFANPKSATTRHRFPSRVITC